VNQKKLERLSKRMYERFSFGLSGDGPYDMGYTLFAALVASGMLQRNIGQSTSTVEEVIRKALDDLEQIETVLWNARDVAVKKTKERLRDDQQ